MRPGGCVGRWTVAWRAETIGSGQCLAPGELVTERFPSKSSQSRLAADSWWSQWLVGSLSESVRLLVFTGFACSPSLATLHGAMFS